MLDEQRQQTGLNAGRTYPAAHVVSEFIQPAPLGRRNGQLLVSLVHILPILKQYALKKPPFQAAFQNAQLTRTTLNYFSSA
jgi:hypothetical protein